jgi:hypothetical protein
VRPSFAKTSDTPSINQKHRSRRCDRVIADLNSNPRAAPFRAKAVISAGVCDLTTIDRGRPRAGGHLGPNRTSGMVKECETSSGDG